MGNWNVDSVLESLEGEFKHLEQIRREVLGLLTKGRTLMWQAGLSSIAVGFITLLLSRNFFGVLVGVPIFFIASLVINKRYFAKGKAKYRAVFKGEMMKKVVSAVEPELRYQAWSGLSENHFMASGLYGTRPDRYHSEDLYEGRIGKTQICFAEVHAEEKKTRTDSNGRRKTYWVTIFRGMLVIADFHKNFRSPVSVLPDVAERNFGWFGKQLQKLGGGLQRLENAEFEQCFVVRGRDPVEVRYILTPSMQERLVALRTRVGDGLRVGFRDSRVWLALPHKGDWFEPDLNKAAFSRDQLRMILGQMRSCCHIVEELDLNTRIWTKE